MFHRSRLLEAGKAATGRQTSWMRIGAFVALAASAILRFLAAVHGYPVIAPDSFGFAGQSKLSIFDPRFWGSQHPPLLPLLWKLDPAATTVAPIPQFGEVRPLIVINVIVGVASWGFLAFVVASTRKTGLVRALAFLAILAVSLAPAVAGWDHALLGESLGLSLEAVVVACAVGYLTRRRSRWAFGLGAALLAAILARETDVLLAVPIAVPVVVVARARERWLIAAALALGLAATAWGQHASKERTWVPLRDSLLIAMYRDGYAPWFKAHGMPVGPSTRELLAERPSKVFTTDPRGRTLLRWMESDGSRVWYTFLAEHWRFASRPIRDPGLATDGRPADDAPYLETSPLLTNVAYPTGALFWVFAALGGVGLVVARRIRETGVVLALLLFVVALAVLVPNLDPFDVQRHAIGGEVAARLAFAMAVLFTLDVWACRNQRRAASRS